MRNLEFKLGGRGRRPILILERVEISGRQTAEIDMQNAEIINQGFYYWGRRGRGLVTPPPTL
jgi:hypothetical protein